MSSLDAAPESLVGKALAVTLTFDPLSASRCSNLDWLGVYSTAIPTVPGVSLGNWIYLGESYATTQPKADGTLVLRLTLPQSKMPKHQGNFELRFHRSNSYGTPEISKKFKLLRRPISLLKRGLVVGLFLIVVAGCQNMLNAKGSCPIAPAFLASSSPVYPGIAAKAKDTAATAVGDTAPAFLASNSPGIATKAKDTTATAAAGDTQHGIEDYALLATESLNHWFITHPTAATALQALCSASIDVSMVTMVVTGAFRRSSTKPFLALFLLMMLRFVAQSAAVMPCAPGFIWPRGALFGWPIPSLFVDYHPSNDYFFSGHTGTVLTAGLQFLDMDYPFLAWVHFGVLLPFTVGLVVSFRAHRGIDVLTGVLAAVAACSMAEKLAVPLDRMLEVAEFSAAAAEDRRSHEGRAGTANAKKINLTHKVL